MQRLATSNIAPAGHPISRLPKKLKIKYLRGIGEALSGVAPHSDASNKAKFCYDVLCELLLGERMDDGWSQSKNNKNIKAAQSLQRKSFRLVRMVHCFWWDVFRIAYEANLPILNKQYYKPLRNTVGLFTHKFFDSAESHFFGDGDGNGNALPPVLVKQSKAEITFHNQRLKRILIVGTMSAGKSTLVNALVGKNVADVRTSVCTTTISYIYNNPFSDRNIFTDGVSISIEEESGSGHCSLSHKATRFESPLSQQHVVIIDTPGVDYAYDESHQQIAYGAINNEEYDVLLCVVNAPYYERNGEMELLDRIINIKNKKVIIIFNQLDRFKTKYDSIEESLKQFGALLKSKQCNAQVIPFSAKTAYMLMQEQNNTLDKFDDFELALLKEKFSADFYDLGNYGTCVQSYGTDYLSRCGLTNLITTIQN